MFYIEMKANHKHYQIQNSIPWVCGLRKPFLLLRAVEVHLTWSRQAVGKSSFSPKESELANC